MPLPPQTYIEFGITAPRSGDSAPVFLFFFRAGIPAASIVTTEFKTLTRWTYYTRSHDEIKKLFRQFECLKMRGCKAEMKILGRADWLLRWQDYFHTMPFGRRFTVVPLWEKSSYQHVRGSQRVSIYLDPCGAFGSGAHETTRLMEVMMESFAGRFESFLDIGTGTGILAVAARKLGAIHVTGVDLDRGSVAAAKKNFALNGEKKGSFVHADILKYQSLRPYALVAANFISADLVNCRRAILSQVKPGGWLLVSGISLKNLSTFLKDFKTPGFRRIKIRRGRSWAGVIYRREKTKAARLG